MLLCVNENLYCVTHIPEKLICCLFRAETRELNASFGSSLLLANSPMSPKIVNGSFAAIFDNGDNVLEEFSRTFSRFRLEAKDSPGNVKEIGGENINNDLSLLLYLHSFYKSQYSVSIFRYDFGLLL